MAEAEQSVLEDVTSMNSKKLIKYLKDQGIVGDDLEKIEEGGYNGKTILHLAGKHKDRLYKLKLSDSSTAVLEDLFKKCIPDEKKKPPEHPDHSDKEIFTSFGLGYGIDASELKALLNIHGRVRTVLSDLTNVEEREQNHRDTYEKKISSVKSHKESVNLSVSDLVGKVLTLSAEAEYSRETTQELLATGEKVITRIISFKPFYSMDYQKEGEVPKDSILEEELAKWIMEKIPAVQSAAGSTRAEKVEQHLKDFPKHFEDAVEAAYLFVKTEKLTHYVQAVDLGAAKYTLSIVSKSKSSAGGELEAKVKKVGGGGAKVDWMAESSRKTEKDQMIGDIEHVSRNNGEEVVGANIMPIFTLITRGVIKHALQKAIVLYLNRESGPFVISCGEHNNKYLHVVEIAHKKQVLGVEERAKASIFYILTRDTPSVFNIAHYGSKESDRYSKSGMYLMANTKFGHDHGPLEVGGFKATDFILNHPLKDDSMLSIEYWETDGCFVRLSPHLFQLKSFMGFDEANLKTVCVRSLKDEGEANNVWLRFQIHHTRDESSYRIPTYGSSHEQDSSKDGNGETSEKHGEPEDSRKPPNISDKEKEQQEGNGESQGGEEESRGKSEGAVGCGEEEREVRGSIRYKDSADGVSDCEDS